MRLSGKRALITGGSGGLGQAIAQRFLAEGARVVAAARSLAVCPLVAGDPRPFVHDHVDVREQGSIEDVIGRTVRRWGGLDILVTAAGAMHNARIGNFDETMLDEMIMTNLGGTIKCVNAAKSIMCKARSGSIVTIGSAITLVTRDGTAAYAATKAGVETFTRNVAVELAPHGVRVNCISPGFIAAGMAAPALAHAQHGPAITRGIALGRPGDLEEVTGPVSFLVSDEATYLAGTVLHVHGGLR